MRTFYFKARTIGEEKYLTYTMGEDCELDEDVLDYIEENKPSELIDIIYEEDDDYDYLTYDITDKISLEQHISKEVKCEDVLLMLRNIANSLISLKEQTVHLNYILLNRNFAYVDAEMNVQFMCVPVESKGSLAVEFKGFVRELLANMKYDVDEDLGYVGKLLTYINGDSFNLRGLIGLSEALMEEEGISFEEAGGIEADGVEVVSSDMDAAEDKKDNLADFMNSSDDADEPLPEIGDDEEEEDVPQIEQEEIESIVPKKNEEEEEPENTETIESPMMADESEEEISEVAKEKTEKTEPTLGVKETDVDVIKSRLQAIVGHEPAKDPEKIKSIEDLDNMLNRPPTVKKNVVKVNRAALIQSAVEHEADGDNAGLSSEEVTKSATVETAAEAVTESKPKSNSILSKTVEAATPSFATTIVKANPYLIRVNTEERIMINKPVFKLGKSARGVDYTVGGNGAISRQHAIIIQKDGVCYIRDNKSTNHTYVNDVMVEEGVDEILTHDSMIRLGDEEFKFKIR